MTPDRSPEGTRRFRLLLGFLLVVIGLGGWIALRDEQPPIGLVFQTAPILSPTGFSLVLTNPTRHRIAIELLSPQMKCDDGWAPNLTVVVDGSEVGKFRPLQVGAPGPGRVRANLAPGQSIVAVGTVPKRIAAPRTATAWRIPVAWSYAPTGANWRMKALDLLSGRGQVKPGVVYTNFSEAAPL